MKKLLALFILPLLVAGSLGPVFAPSASAVTAADWKAGRIIDDGKFTGLDMSVADIQNFLNSKVPVCDTWGTQPASEYGRSDINHAQYAASRGWPAPPYVCLKNYHEVPKTAPGPGVPANSYGNGGNPPAGSVSAAQMIYNAAQTHRISPKVLLVKLATESAGPLTTDKWPLQKQYTYAMGAYCPDSGPGGSANCNTNYAGFSIQMSEAAELLRWYLDSMTQPWWQHKRPYATNNILWNVAPSNCGGGNVYIETMGTAALYTYTPYQPNAAALANMYGTGNGCSAYGNRNFWRVYNDWFGNTVGAGYSFVTAVNPPDVIQPNHIVPVSITIKNESGRTWYSDGNVPNGEKPTRLRMGGYTNTPFANINDPAWLGTRNQVKMVEASVPNGSNATFTFTFRGPIGKVDKYITWMAPVIDGVYAYPGIGMGWQTNSPTPNLSYEIVSNSVPRSVDYNSVFGARIAIKNTGNAMWYSDATGKGTVTRLITKDSIYRSSNFYDPLDVNWLNNSQVRMGSATVAPGEIGYFDFNWKAPVNGSTYSEKFTLVLDGAAVMNGSIDLSTKVNDYNYEVVSVSTLPSVLLAGDTQQLTVQLKNTGPKPWYNDTNTASGRPLRLAIKNYGKTAYSATRDLTWITPNQISMNETTVNPGEIGTFTATLAAPYKEVDEYMSFVPIVDGVKWLDESTQLLNKRLTTPKPVYWYSTTASTINPPSTMARGSSASARLAIKNESNVVWRNDDNVKLPVGALRLVTANSIYRTSAFSNQDASWIGTKNQIKMETPVVRPGEVGIFNFSWTAPQNPGSYTEYFSVVIDGQTLLPYRGMGFYTKVE